MDGKARAARVRRFGRGPGDRLLGRQLFRERVDEPHLEVVGLESKLALRQVARLLGRADLDDGRVTEVEQGRATVEMSGPATATRGAATVRRASSRTSKTHIGPPTSTTPVTPLLSQVRNVKAGARCCGRPPARTGRWR